MLSQEKILIITDILKKIPDLACAYLHGSSLTDPFRKDSDKEVVTKGRLIVCNNSYFCKTLVMHTLSMYANLERSKILERYTA